MAKLSLSIIYLLVGFFLQEQEEDKLFTNYKSALKNESTFQYFLVLKAKNLNTGELREYCTKANFLKGALHRELNLDYSEQGSDQVYQLANNNLSRYFEFKNDSAIWKIGGVWEYSMDELKELEQKVNFDSIASHIEETKLWSMQMKEDKLMLQYAHALFNRGILTAENNCFGGTLEYVNEEKN